MDIKKHLKQIEDYYDKLQNENYELQNFKDDAEETCESVPVIKEMEKRIETAENGMEMLIIERDLFEKIDKMSLRELKKHKELYEWYIRYLLGCKLVFDYDLVKPVVKSIDEHKMIMPLLKNPNNEYQYVINEAKSLGYKLSKWSSDTDNHRLYHQRFNFDCQNDEESVKNNFEILKLFNKFYKGSTRPILRSCKGGINYMIIDKKYYYPKSMKYNENIWDIYSEKEVDVSGSGTREIIHEILSKFI